MVVISPCANPAAQGLAEQRLKTFLPASSKKTSAAMASNMRAHQVVRLCTSASAVFSSLSGVVAREAPPSAGVGVLKGLWERKGVRLRRGRRPFPLLDREGGGGCTAAGCEYGKSFFLKGRGAQCTGSSSRTQQCSDCGSMPRPWLCSSSSGSLKSGGLRCRRRSIAEAEEQQQQRKKGIAIRVDDVNRGEVIITRCEQQRPRGLGYCRVSSAASACGSGSSSFFSSWAWFSSSSLRKGRGRKEIGEVAASVVNSGERKTEDGGPHRRGDVAAAAAAGSAEGSGDLGELSDGEGEEKEDDSELIAQEMAVADSRIIPVELHKEVTDSYVAYAMSVIVGRALPDVRDGLKPVHRRILFSMKELGLSSSKPFRKCARVVGEVLGKYHPHGDSAVYESLVRMAQDFSLRSPLVNGHGNFGSVDADPPAAMRYTECRLTALSESMLLADLDMDTVVFSPNFDDSQKEPVVLPARLPNLLVNGSQGIAVGMATNIPPHNLSEVADALCALIRNPNATVQELMEHMPGPDFPTAGKILGTSGLVAAYQAGRGGLVVRGTATIEQKKSGNRSVIIISEIPYQTNKAAFVKKIAELVNSKALEGVSDIRDESDRTGMRVVVEVKRGAIPAVVLNNLYKQTNLQTKFSCNMVALVNGEPKVLGLKDFLEEFLEFRCKTIERRTAFELRKAEERNHIVEGLVIALDNMSEVVACIRGATDSRDALASLQRSYGLSVVQAEGVLAMPLRRLTSLERGKLVGERNELTASIAVLRELLSSRKKILDTVERETKALKKEYGTPRRTVIETDQDGEISDIDVIPNEESIVLLSERGYIKRMRADLLAAQRRGGTGKTRSKLKLDDAMALSFACRVHDHVLLFSDRGVLYSLRAYQIPEAGKTSGGTHVAQVLSLVPGEKITSVVPVSQFSEHEYLVMLTSAGFVKRTPVSAFKHVRSTGIAAIQLTPGDELKWVRRFTKGDWVVVASKKGNCVKFDPANDQLRSSGRLSRGSRAMRLKEGDSVAAVDIIPSTMAVEDETVEAVGERPMLLAVTRMGFGKRTLLSNIPPRKRGQSGVILLKFREGDELEAMHVVGGGGIGERGGVDEEVVIGSDVGILNRVRLSDIPVYQRSSSGVRLMRIADGDRVKTVTVVPRSADSFDDDGDGDEHGANNSKFGGVLQDDDDDRDSFTPEDAPQTQGQEDDNSADEDDSDEEEEEKIESAKVQEVEIA